jgi:RNA 2',3'-cyclic 3'-phosphodiesterase
MRCFIALELSPEIKREIRKISEELEKENLFNGKITEEGNIHLTLKFLGEISEKEIEETKNKLKEIKFQEFTGEISEIGFFSPHFIRIIWIKLDGESVFELQKQIDEKLACLFNNEVRFMSHITIARVKNVLDKDKLIDFLEKIDVELKNKKIKFKINKFTLKKSELFPEGPIYNNIEEYISEN